MIHFFVSRPVLAHCLFVILLAGGIFSLMIMPVESIPTMPFGMVVVQTFWVGASPEDVEKLVTDKLEKQIENVDHIVWSRSASLHGISTIWVKFEENLSDEVYHRLYQDVESEIKKVDDLPKDAEVPRAIKVSTDLIRPTIVVAVGGDIPEASRKKIARQLREKLQRIPDIAKVRMSGEREREIEIEVDRDRARHYRISLPELVAIIKRENKTLPAGSIENRGEEILVRTAGELENIEQIREIILISDNRGHMVQLKDIAQVKWGYRDWRMMARASGGPAVFLSCTKRERANTLQVVPQVRETVRRFQERLPSGVKIAFFKDNVVYIDKVLKVLKSNLSLGMALVMLVLWVWIGFSNASLAALGIPFSFLCSLIFLNWIGISINELVLVALVLVSGMVVDDAIIIIENMYRHHQEGKDLCRAAQEGAAEVFWPVVSATATTVAAFLPMLIMTGILGKVMAIIPKTVALVLAASLIEAFLILPCHYIELSKISLKITGGRRKGLIASTLRRVTRLDYSRIARAYLWTVRTFIRFRYITVPSLLLFLIVGLLLLLQVRTIPVVLFPSDYQDFWVNIRVHAGSSLEYTAEKLGEVEKIIAGLPKEEVINYTAEVGRMMDKDYRVDRFNNIAQITVTLNPQRSTNRSASEIMVDLRSRIAQANLHGFEHIEVAGLPSGPQTGKPVAVRISGKNLKIVRKLSLLAKDYLKKMPGVSGVSDNVYRGNREISIRIREEQLTKYGISRENVAVAVNAAIEGIEATEIHDGKDHYKIRVRYRAEDIFTQDDIARIHLKTRDGVLIRLDDIATLERKQSAASFDHFNSQRTVTITAEVDNVQATSTSANSELRRLMTPHLKKNPEYLIQYGGEFEETSKSFTSLKYAFVIALILIFTILGTQFNSAMQALVVMSVIPFSMLGVAYGLWMFQLPFTMLIFISMVGLAGVVVNDSLVLIDFINREKKEAPLKDAILHACVKRLRPILLTTFTTIFGLLPLSLGLSGKSITWTPMATGFSWGLGVSTLLTLLVVPACYHIVEDFKDLLTKK